MCLLNSVLVGVQAPRWVVDQRLLFVSSFSGSGASNRVPPTMGIAVALSSIATAISLCWRQMVACSKAHDSVRRSGWPTPDRADNNVADMAILLVPLNLRRDSTAPEGAKRVITFCLI